MRRQLAVFAISAVVLMCSVGDGAALMAARTRLCALSRWTTPEELRQVRLKEFNQSAAVFTGKVSELQGMTARLTVDRYWKGDLRKDVTILTGFHTPPNGWDVEAYVFEKGREYLVYAEMLKGRLATNSCTWTQPLDKAGDDIKALDTFATAKIAR